jgi:hypothetical protein
MSELFRNGRYFRAVPTADISRIRELTITSLINHSIVSSRNQQPVSIHRDLLEKDNQGEIRSVVDIGDNV